MSEENQPDWTNPQFCPYCQSENLVENEKWEQRECQLPEELRESDIDETRVGFRIHGKNECGDCEGEFETLSKIRSYAPRHDTHTIQIVWDEDVDSIIGVKYIEGGEDDISVKSERAKWNMKFGGCGEFQGPEYAMRDVYDFLVENSKIDSEEKTFQAGKWLADIEQDS